MTATKPNAERGVAIVEAALTLLLLFICLFGLMEVSLLISVQQALTNAAREGARARVAPYSQTSYGRRVRRQGSGLFVPQCGIDYVRPVNRCVRRAGRR